MKSGALRTVTNADEPLILIAVCSRAAKREQDRGQRGGRVPGLTAGHTEDALHHLCRSKCILKLQEERHDERDIQLLS